MKKIYTIAAALIILTGNIAFAQDIHFSQFYAAPIYLNPAKTGFFNGNYRLTAIYRNQWKSVTEPYQTISGSADFSVATGPDRKDMFGFGLMAFSDRAGDSHFTTTQFEGSLAYNKCLDRYGRSYVGLGLQGGYVSSYLDYSLLTFDENFEGGATTENFAYNSAGYPDVSAGLEWNYLADKQKNFSLGLSVFHINEPVQTFMGDASSVVYRKVSANAGATLPVTPQLAIYPKVYYSMQGPHREMVFGAFGRFGMEKKGTNEYALYFGAMERWNDAAIFLVRFDINDFAFTFSYDFNHSKLARVSNGMGGPELSVQYIGGITTQKKKRVFCPKF